MKTPALLDPTLDDQEELTRSVPDAHATHPGPPPAAALDAAIRDLAAPVRMTEKANASGAPAGDARGEVGRRADTLPYQAPPVQTGKAAAAEPPRPRPNVARSGDAPAPGPRRDPRPAVARPGISTSALKLAIGVVALLSAGSVMVVALVSARDRSASSRPTASASGHAEARSPELSSVALPAREASRSSALPDAPPSEPAREAPRGPEPSDGPPSEPAREASRKPEPSAAPPSEPAREAPARAERASPAPSEPAPAPRPGRSEAPTGRVIPERAAAAPSAAERSPVPSRASAPKGDASPGSERAAAPAPPSTAKGRGAPSSTAAASPAANEHAKPPTQAPRPTSTFPDFPEGP